MDKALDRKIASSALDHQIASSALDHQIASSALDHQIASSAYDPKKTEDRIYKFWEEKGYFKPEINSSGKPYSIILPPPNANAPLHFGHAMYVIEDILIRYHRMKGDKALWLPGADHAGFETQFVFEKHLKSEGKSRFDFDRETLYQMIWDFVQSNRPVMENQLKKLGFSLDWSRKKFTLDKDIVSIVYKTFKKLFDDKLVFRAKRLVNYCTFDGTSFSDLEVIHKEKESSLYFVKYFFEKGGGHITVATTRPETIIADVAVAVNPKDKRYKNLDGKSVVLPVFGRKVPIIYDDLVDMKFGTGVLKITPGHDPNDFEIAQKHKLKGESLIGFNGKITEGKYKGLYVKEAREKIVEDLEKEGFLEKEEKIMHQVPVCYKCQNPIEPLLMDQWFIKMQPLAKDAIEKIKKDEIKIFPNRFEKVLLDFLKNIKDWNISRQIVWGIRIPAFKNKKTGEWLVTEGESPGKDFDQDTDTFDTWFSSAQWPFATLEVTGDFKEFYPTSVMETGYDILRWWVARMIMIGLYATGKVPFKNVVLHGLVNDPLGKKMSKSKGNVVNPLELVEEYGADAVRFALVFGTALGSDQALSFPKFQNGRNFANKLWNMARFIEMNEVQSPPASPKLQRGEKSKVQSVHRNDIEMKNKVQVLVKEVTKDLDSYNFNFAAEKLYEFVWHEFADKYIEDVKKRIDKQSFTTLHSSFLILLKLLHPFMPFVTEEIYQKFKPDKSIIVEKWPQ